MQASHLDWAREQLSTKSETLDSCASQTARSSSAGVSRQKIALSLRNEGSGVEIDSGKRSRKAAFTCRSKELQLVRGS